MLTTDRAKTHKHTDKRRNRFLKHKLINTSYRISITTQTKQVHPDMTSHITMISEE